MFFFCNIFCVSPLLSSFWGQTYMYMYICLLVLKIAWRSGVVAARKRRFALACCKGSAIQAVACVQIGPKNESVRGFLAQEAYMSVCLLNVDPASPQFKAGAHLCREVSQRQR